VPKGELSLIHARTPAFACNSRDSCFFQQPPSNEGGCWLFVGIIAQKYKQVSIEISLPNAASLYHQNSTGKQTKFTLTIQTTIVMKKPIVTNNNAKRVSLTEQQLNAVKGGMQLRAKRAELPTN
jgi:hypothetical protein